MLKTTLLTAYLYATVARAKHLTSQIADTDDATMLEFRRDAELRLIGWKIIEAIDAGYTISIKESEDKV